MESLGKLNIEQDAANECLRRDLRCHGCSCELPNMPKLKTHLASCSGVSKGPGAAAAAAAAAGDCGGGGGDGDTDA